MSEADGQGNEEDQEGFHGVYLRVDERAGVANATMAGGTSPDNWRRGAISDVDWGIFCLLGESIDGIRLIRYGRNIQMTVTHCCGSTNGMNK